MLHEFDIRMMGKGIRCRWVYDDHYQTRGSYAYDTEGETKVAEDYEIERLESGEWVVLGCIVERECDLTSINHTLGMTTESTRWIEIDSLWGIVIEPDGAKLDEFARYSMEGLN